MNEENQKVEDMVDEDLGLNVDQVSNLFEGNNTKEADHLINKTLSSERNQEEKKGTSSPTSKKETSSPQPKKITSEHNEETSSKKNAEVNHNISSPNNNHQESSITKTTEVQQDHSPKNTDVILESPMKPSEDLKKEDSTNNKDIKPESPKKPTEEVKKEDSPKIIIEVPLEEVKKGESPKKPIEVQHEVVSLKKTTDDNQKESPNKNINPKVDSSTENIKTTKETIESETENKSDFKTVDSKVFNLEVEVANIVSRKKVANGFLTTTESKNDPLFKENINKAIKGYQDVLISFTYLHFLSQILVDIQKIEEKNPAIDKLPAFKAFTSEKSLVMSNLALALKKLGLFRESIACDLEVIPFFNLKQILTKYPKFDKSYARIIDASIMLDDLMSANFYYEKVLIYV